MKMSRTSLLSILTLLFFGVCAGHSGAASSPAGDPFMGDWEGERVAANGEKSPLVAQVIALGDGQYQANILEAFDRRIAPIAVLGGTLSESGPVFRGESDQGSFKGTRWTARIASGEKGDALVFSGELQDPASGTFRMKKVVRPSPTLGKKPPEGAVVLFDGTNTDAWRHPAPPPWIIDIGRALGGGQDCVAYLRCAIVSPAESDAILELGSDDGAKVWLNGEVVLAQNVMRGLQPGQDKVPVKLKGGENHLVLKVLQGGAGWAACARFRAPGGGEIAGLKVQSLGEGQGQKPRPEGAEDYILDWEVSGPYAQEGKKPEEIFDVAFAPETKDERAQWRAVRIPTEADFACKWKIVEGGAAAGGGAMEITPRTGSIISKREFRDHELHLEFRTPFEPKARGQGRGNSGVYFQSRYEIQVLDSYGLEGLSNECGGIYGVGAPRVNMCAPPLQWQTYDVTFRAPRFDAAGQKTENARLTAYHNGVLIHDNIEVPGLTTAGMGGDLSKPAGLYLQDHGNPVRYRNIWVVELD
ncbi:MAG TPA: DUF1080 domain-containing protein [Sumerlaeia bacterium]|nr:DUF1080 domain-containing protein [Sumerlaeia bacterium]